jgi:hypothetical protein
VSTPFNARAIFWFRADRLYRIYCTNDVLRFIRIGGQNWGLAYGLESQAGAAGSSLAKRLRNREQEKLRQAELEVDSFDPEFLIPRHRHNFKTYSHEVTEARFLPTGAPIHGPHFGRLHLKFREGARLRLQFETPENLQIAIETLTRTLAGLLVVTQEPVHSELS